MPSYELTPEELNEFDDMCEEAEGMFFVKNQIDLMQYMPEDWHPCYRELYRKVHGFCPDGTCSSAECENCKPN